MRSEQKGEIEICTRGLAVEAYFAQYVTAIHKQNRLWFIFNEDVDVAGLLLLDVWPLRVGPGFGKRDWVSAHAGDSTMNSTIDQ